MNIATMEWFKQCTSNASSAFVVIIFASLASTLSVDEIVTMIIRMPANC